MSKLDQAKMKAVLSKDILFVTEKGNSILSTQTQGLNILRVESFTSELTLANALISHKIAQGTKLLLYDNEPWTLTPKNEQANPLKYYQEAANLSHRYGYLLIATPVSKIDNKIDDEIASYVDVIDIQSQYDESNPLAYQNHVLPIAKAAKLANPSLIILSGLSTNPRASDPSLNELHNDVTALNQYVNGFWLNIPSPGTACPRCNAPNPQLGISFLQSINGIQL